MRKRIGRYVIAGIGALLMVSWIVGPVGGAETEERGGRLRELIKQRLEERRAARTGERGTGDRGSRDSAQVQIDEIDSSYSRFNDAPLAPGYHERTLTHDGRDRFYDVYVPRGYTSNKALPVVLVFHGGAGNPKQQIHDSVMKPVADENGFIAVYPAGTGILKTRILTYNAGICCAYAKKHKVDDVGFTAALIDDLATLVNIDKKRVYATGFSNGAFMAYRLASELSNRIAAIAPVSGVLGVDDVRPSRAVPIIHFHGKKDPNAVYDGGIGPNAREKIARRGVRETIGIFLDLYGLPKTPTKTQRVGQAVGETYGPDANGVEIVLWTLEDGGHTWPGGNSSISESKMGKLSMDISATELMWEFFKRYSLP